jgi:uncharacterized membrane protein
MKNLKKEWLQILLLVAPFCAVALLWARLPERVPIHWNIHGQVNGYAGRGFGALFVPCMNLLMVLLIALVARIDPRLRRQTEEARASSLRVFKSVRLAFSFFLAVLAVTVLCIAVGMPLDLSRILAAGLSLLFLVLGNLMGKIRPNYFVGVRTPWTLESPEVWQKTHRLAGRIMVGGALLLLAGAVALPREATFVLLLPVVVVMALVPVIYSYVAYKKQQPV